MICSQQGRKMPYRMVAVTPFRRVLFECSVNAFSLLNGYSKGGAAAKGTEVAEVTKNSLPVDVFGTRWICGSMLATCVGDSVLYLPR